MRRREFIAGLGGVTALSHAARAQKLDRVRRIAVLLAGFSNERNSDGLVAFRETMAKLGWIEGRNLQIDVRAGASNPNRISAFASELVGLAPDAIVTTSLLSTRAVQQQTQSIPIIFTGVGGDPVAARVVTSIARPEGNVTGFTNLFTSISGKWIELLKAVAPRVTRVALLFNPAATFPLGYLSAAEAAAPALAVQPIRMSVRDDLELVRAIDAFAAEHNGGLVALPPVAVNLSLLFRLVAQHELPAIFPDRAYMKWGQLVSYGSNSTDLYRGAASYVDRILRGSKVSELPVQYPSKFELVFNLKTAKALGLTIPETLLATADEIIQ